MIKQGRVQQLTVQVFAEKETLGKAAALFVAEKLTRAMQQKGHAAMILATGASQYEFLAALLQQVVIWSNVIVFHLDEYIGLAEDHPASFRRYLNDRFLQYITPQAVHLMDGNATDLNVECRRYGDLLSAQRIDVACVGIGENAHLAFNDPPADLFTTELVHVVQLSEDCRRQQVGEGHFPDLDAVPQQALSLSIPAILGADSISCVVPDARKADAIRCALTQPVSAWCPASALQYHPNTFLFLDTFSYGDLDLI